ncbi:hypothetical protein CHARACLAT_013513 [Characodon lateralis]|uniref:Uncharacterized protein n=1 Tax=Characodon lateralis TaxID=208331 RepID=A0ABU7E084_9TELE|nr:hypothetical protein [Characodon lateralis]
MVSGHLYISGLCLSPKAANALNNLGHVVSFSLISEPGEHSPGILWATSDSLKRLCRRAARGPTAEPNGLSRPHCLNKHFIRSCCYLTHSEPASQLSVELPKCAPNALYPFHKHCSCSRCRL